MEMIKKILFLLLFPLSVFGQNNIRQTFEIGRIDSIAVTDLSTIHTFKVGGVRYYNPVIVDPFTQLMTDSATVLYYSYLDDTTIIKDLNNKITIWEDKSIYGYNLTQSDTSKSPVLTESGLLFNGTDNVLFTADFALSQPTTVYIVLKQITMTDADYFFDGTSNGTGGVVQYGTGGYVRAYAGVNSGHTAVPINEYCIIRVTFDSDNSILVVNDNTPITGNFGANNMVSFTLGSRGSASSAYSNIEVKCIVVRKVNDSDSVSDIIYNTLYNTYLSPIESAMFYRGLLNENGVLEINDKIQ